MRWPVIVCEWNSWPEGLGSERDSTICYIRCYRKHKLRCRFVNSVVGVFTVLWDAMQIASAGSAKGLSHELKAAKNKLRHSGIRICGLKPSSQQIGCRRLSGEISLAPRVKSPTEQIETPRMVNDRSWNKRKAAREVGLSRQGLEGCVRGDGASPKVSLFKRKCIL
jgi:hypothetical protein